MVILASILLCCFTLYAIAYLVVARVLTPLLDILPDTLRVEIHPLPALLPDAAMDAEKHETPPNAILQYIAKESEEEMQGMQLREAARWHQESGNWDVVLQRLIDKYGNEVENG